MGYWKNLQIFCQQHKLDPHKRDTQAAYEADRKGLPWRVREAVSKSDCESVLTWDEIEMLTGARSGTHNTACPYCGSGAQYSTVFKTERTPAHAKWVCFYCGVKGTTDNPEGVPSEKQAAAERELIAEQRAQKRERSLRLWDDSGPITTGSIPDIYLKARGLELPPNPDAVLRWHPECPFAGSKLPCMVALFRDALTDQPTGIHRTYIYAPAVGRSERRAWGTISGSAIKLWPLGDSDSLAVGEGIETVLAAVKLGVTHPPAWASSVANNLSRLPVINSVRRLTILADNDANKVSQREAIKLYHTYNHVGCDALIKHPSTVDSDFNDLLRSELKR
jgi:hypothetical protein